MKYVAHIESDEQGVWPLEAIQAFKIQEEGAAPWDVLDALAGLTIGPALGEIVDNHCYG